MSYPGTVGLDADLDGFLHAMLVLTETTAYIKHSKHLYVIFKTEVILFQNAKKSKQREVAHCTIHMHIIILYTS